MVPPRRKEVVDLLFEGCSNKEIAEALGINCEIVKRQIHCLFVQTGTSDRVGLICKLRQQEVLQIPPRWDLTPIECEVALLVGKGMLNKEIAEQVNRPHASVKNIVHRIFNKAGVWSRLELALRIRDMQVIQ